MYLIFVPFHHANEQYAIDSPVCPFSTSLSSMLNYANISLDRIAMLSKPKRDDRSRETLRAAKIKKKTQT